MIEGIISNGTRRDELCRRVCEGVPDGLLGYLEDKGGLHALLQSLATWHLGELQKIQGTIIAVKRAQAVRPS